MLILKDQNNNIKDLTLILLSKLLSELLIYLIPLTITILAHIYKKYGITGY